MTQSGEAASGIRHLPRVVAIGGGVLYPPIFRETSKADLNRDALRRLAGFLDEPGSQTYDGNVRARDGLMHDVVYYKATYSGPEDRVCGVIGTIVTSRVTEKTASGYVRANYALGASITGNIGVRYVHTDQVSSGTLIVGNEPKAASFPKTFNNWLPSFNLRAELSPTLVARLAASRVLTRPNVTQSSPQISVSTDAATGSGGNPELLPFVATQFDGSLEWYFSRKGSLTGAVFYKAMDDYITQQNVNVEIPGRGIIQLSTQVNGGDAKVYGAEAAYNQVFTFLLPNHSISAER